ncbi:MAG TPA: excinuclease ABC subunit UvrA [Ignavibacteria bacterium]|nr:excinuclease ABC subunit UvrA [Ignavibacteria bacterium]HMQ99111.1 excinuclease ABC subunit UvrA [Ignavibacteria bacterium]
MPRKAVIKVSKDASKGSAKKLSLSNKSNRKVSKTPNSTDLENRDSRIRGNMIEVKGARVNNLKNISVDIPHNKFVVVTGLSGSGKTSLVFDTIYAEGQRRYIESMSSYARQFLERINKPDVDSITGLAPSMAIEVKTTTRNPRSTVGTSTEIYDYLRLLYARAGKTYSPVSGKEVQRDTIEGILKFINTLENKTRLYILFPVHTHEKKSVKQEIENLIQKGFIRIFDGKKIIELNQGYDEKKIKLADIKVVVDRLALNKTDEEQLQRIAGSLEQAYVEGDGYLYVMTEADGFTLTPFNLHLEADGIRFEEPEPLMFSFNNPIGACPKCQGFGETIDIDENLIVPDRNKSIFQNAIHPFSTPKHSKHLSDLIFEGKKNNVRVHVPFKDLTKEEVEKVYKGMGEYLGVNKFFRMVEREAAYKIHYRVLLSRYRAYTKCTECEGSRLRKEALYVKVAGKTIKDLVQSSIEELYFFFNEVKLDKMQQEIAGRILEEIKNRLKYLFEVGLGYLTIDRLTSTLSGGESQRINLATSLGSSLVGSIYVLDEPSVGLHPRDNDRLIKILKSLRDIGNSVIVVEHDPDMINASDYMIDIGPKAGEFGGEVVFAGDIKDITKSKDSLTAKYLTGKMKIDLPARRRAVNGHVISIRGASENNLKDLNVDIPLGIFVCITGVSGSGKSTLISDILYGAIKKRLEGIYNEKIGQYREITGHQHINAIELVDQTPIGRSPRSNPVTYMKIFDLIRDVYGSLPASKLRGFSAGNFSFNVPGGRCETCEGSGVIKIAMQFMADIYLECDVCKGKRYKSEILEAEYKGKSISDVLQLSITEAIAFFKDYPRITAKLKILDEVGLGYLRLGQSATTLSGGEAQRIKLAFHLSFQTAGEKTLFIFDEPTTGLHLYDISKLLKCFNELIAKGNSVVVVEHNLEVIKCADYVIDIGPDSGNKGGEVVAKGTPEEVAKSKNSFTAGFLKKMLK